MAEVLGEAIESGTRAPTEAQLPLERPVFLGQEAVLLPPTEVLKGIRALGQQLEREAQQSIPPLSDLSDRRGVVNFLLFLKDHPDLGLTSEKRNFLLQTVKTHRLEDARYHAAEALGAALQVSDLSSRRDLTAELTAGLAPESLNDQVVDALDFGQVEQEEGIFRELPEVLQIAGRIKRGKITGSELTDFIGRSPLWRVDVLELAGKYLLPGGETPELGGHISALIAESGDSPLNHPNWKIRALAADLARLDQLKVDPAVLYNLAKTDPHEEVRVRARNAFSARVGALGKDEVRRWQEVVLDDFTRLPEDELRFIAAALPQLLPHLPPAERSTVKTKLKEISRTNAYAYNRKTALKTLIKLGPYLSENEQSEITNFVIGSLCDEALIVQEEALLSLRKRANGELTARQAKKILTNLDLEGKDWFYQNLVTATLINLGERQYAWAADANKPKILMFPGTFDPIHLGHLETAQKAAELTEREVWIVPNAQLRRKNPLGVEQRVQMIERALAELPDIYVPPMRLFQQANGSWVDNKVDKLKILATHAGEVGLLRGADVLSHHGYTDADSALLKIFHVISNRGEKETEAILASRRLPWPVVNQSETITSTHFRELISQGEMAQALTLVPPLQAQLLRATRWYQLNQ